MHPTDRLVTGAQEVLEEGVNHPEASPSSDVSNIAGRIPRHLAIIMDGNGRWAQDHSQHRVEGHRAGARNVRMVVEEARRLGIRYLTLYAFSSENWKRPKTEVSALMFLFRQYLQSEIGLLVKHGIRLRVIGRRNTLPNSVRRLVENVENATEQLSSMELLLAISYGGRDELVDAMRKISRRVIKGEITPEDINAEVVAENLYAPDVPDPDLLIRTSDEFRISNFLLWQLAYSELIVSPFRWPDFSREEFHRCLNDFSRRERRFGQTSDQLKAIGYGC